MTPPLTRIVLAVGMLMSGCGSPATPIAPTTVPSVALPLGTFDNDSIIRETLKCHNAGMDAVQNWLTHEIMCSPKDRR